MPSARCEVMEEEAQPFQEIPGSRNVRVHEFWQDAERQHSGGPRS
jgi:hypothetical protein